MVLMAMSERRQVEPTGLNTHGNLLPTGQGFDVHTSELQTPFAESPGEMPPTKPPPSATKAAARPLTTFSPLPPASVQSSSLRSPYPCWGLAKR